MSTDELAGLLLSETVQGALALAAASRPPGHALHTGPVLDALARVDHFGDWSRLWLHAGALEQLGLANAVDGEIADLSLLGPGSQRSWQGVPLSPTLGRAMSLLAAMARRYSMRPVPPGALALALVGVPMSGAAATLLAHTDAPIHELLAIIESDLLGTALTGFDDLRNDTNYGTYPDSDASASDPVAVVPPSPLAAAEALAGTRTADDLDLIQILLRDKTVTSVMSTAGVDLPTFAEVAQTARPLGSRPAVDVLEQAQTAAALDTPSDSQLLVAAARNPSRALAAALRTFGTTSSELASAAALTNVERVTSTSVYLSSIANLVASLAVAVVIIVHAVGPGSLWELFFLLFAFSGPPTTSTAFSLLVTAAFWLLGGPIVGAVKLTETVISYWRSRAERRDILRMTGVRLNERQHNRVVQRQRGRRAALLRLRDAGFFDYRMALLTRAAKRAEARPRTNS